MTLQNLYIKLKKNKITKSQFLNEVRKDPYASKFVSSANTFEDAVRILKSREIIQEVKSAPKAFNLSRYLKEIEDEVDQMNADQEPEKKPEVDTEAELPAELVDAVDRFIARLEQTSDYNNFDNVVMMVEKIVRGLGLGKQNSIAVLNTVKSRLL